MTCKSTLEYRQRNKLCYRCGEPVVNNKKMCEKHLSESREKEKKKRLKRKLKSLCIRCGQKPPRKNRTQCLECFLKYKDKYNAQKMDLYYQKRSFGLCVRCGTKTQNYSVHCSKCSEYMKNKDIKRYAEKKEQQLCVHCGTKGPIKNEVLCVECKNHNKIRGLESRKKLKFNIINHYGKKCVCCGEDKMEFLTIDHMNNGGNQHRIQLRKAGTTIYRWLVKNNFPTGFQVLCYNCNSGRYLNGGICPHQEKKK